MPKMLRMMMMMVVIMMMLGYETVYHMPVDMTSSARSVTVVFGRCLAASRAGA